MDLQELSNSSAGLAPNQQQLVRETLQAILDSPEFSKSARYPTLLRYIVLNTLSGNTDGLKERVIGNAVFHRPAGYDPGLDAVVRTTAGEVRRRMAAYFSEHPDSPVRIDLPVGRYTAEFHFRPNNALNQAPDPAPSFAPEQPSPLSASADLPVTEISHAPVALAAKLRPRVVVLIAPVLLIAAAALAVAGYLQRRERKDFWGPVLQADAPALIVIGRNPKDSAAGTAAAQSSGQVTLDDSVSNTALGNAITAARVCSIFRDYKRDCDIAPVQLSTLEQLRNKTVVSIGALDNAWTIRLLAPFRYQFVMEGTDPTSPTARLIVDQFHPQANAWKDTSNGPKLTTDYAMVGRFHSDITDGTVVIAAGVSQLGTIRAGEYLSSPEAFRQLADLAPKGWKGFNFEAILQVDVVQGIPGHVKLIATHFW